jgi:hypothetical protein
MSFGTLFRLAQTMWSKSQEDTCVALILLALAQATG